MTKLFLNIPAALALMAATTVGCSAEPQSSEEPDFGLAEALDAEVSRFVNEQRLPGLSAAVYIGDEPLLLRGYGFADIENEIPVSATTLFAIGSIEKQFTAAAVLRLVEDGRIRLDDPISDYIPRLNTEGQVVTIAQMLHQVSGLQDHSTLPDYDPSTNPDSAPWGAIPDSAVGEGFDSIIDIAAFQGQALYFTPGERFSYSNPNYDLLCYVIAQLSGKTYYDATAELADLAGIEVFHSEWTPRPDPERTNVAHGYAADDDGYELAWEPNLYSAWTTADGLARWARALESGMVVSAASFESMTSAATLNDGRTWPYGFGLELSQPDERPRTTHTGRVPGFYAVLTRYPDDDLTIAIFTNLSGASAIAQELEPQLARLVLGLEEPEVLDIPLNEEEQAALAGTYDAGAFWFEAIPEGERIALRMRTRGDEDVFEYDRTLLYNQGGGRFIAIGAPEWREVLFSGEPAQEISIGTFAQAVRLR